MIGVVMNIVSGLDRAVLETYRNFMKNFDPRILWVEDIGNRRVVVQYTDKRPQSLSYDEVEAFVKSYRTKRDYYE